MNEFSRTELLLGSTGIERLRNSSVAIVGIGGVGGHAADAIARCGVGRLLLMDNDLVTISNINRQAEATHNTLGMKKVDVIARHILSINPSAEIQIADAFYDEKTANDYDFAQYDYVVDAIDSVASKILLIEKAKQAGTPILSCMGAGNRLDPTKFVVIDIMDTRGCPLARVMRKELRKRGIENLNVVYSTEEPIRPQNYSDEYGEARPPGSIAFVPSAAGLVAASQVVKDLLNR